MRVVQKPKLGNYPVALIPGTLIFMQNQNHFNQLVVLFDAVVEVINVFYVR